MCGIVGVGGNLSRDKLKAVVDRMNVAVAHRGPDDEGSLGGRQLRVRHAAARASLTSPTATSPCGTNNGLGIVYNGEVYNYQSLRQVLSRRSGIRFQTTSDTEVVLKSHRAQGNSSGSRLERNVCRRHVA